MHFVVATDVHLRPETEFGPEQRIARIGQREQIRPEVRTAQRVVEVGNAAHDDAVVFAVFAVRPGRPVDVVVERDIERRRFIVDQVVAVDADDADDVAVVADDGVGIARVALVGRRPVGRQVVFSLVGVAVAVDLGPGASEEVVVTVRSLVRILQAEELRAAAHDVVLAEATEDDVVSAAALDVIFAVGLGFIGTDHA